MIEYIGSLKLSGQKSFCTFIYVTIGDTKRKKIGSLLHVIHV